MASTPHTDITTVADTSNSLPLLFRAAWFTLAATVTVMALADWTDQYFTSYRIALVALCQYFLLVHPIYRALKLYHVHNDFMHPAVVGCLTFIVFHILFNTIAITQLDLLSTRGFLVSQSSDFMSTIFLSYAVLACAWLSYHIGSTLFPHHETSHFTSKVDPTHLTLRFSAIGVGFIIIGMIGNIAILGGLDPYFDKMAQFYERWDVWEISSAHGGFKWTIMMKFLPVGLVLLAFGTALYTRSGKIGLTTLLFVAALANIFLSSATGGRGTTLAVAFYALPLLNSYVKRFTVKMLVLSSAILIGFSYVLGTLRAAAYYGTLTGRSLIDLAADIDKFVGFIARYLTNFIGTLTLVSEVKQSGVVWGRTLFAGLTGLLGGETPLTTQVELWWRIRSQFITVNPRYGPPGELFFNFGWPGVIIGMALIGLTVSFLSRMYTSASSQQSIASGIMIIFAATTANFIVIANLSYIPPYFTFYAVPFYFVLWYFRKVKS